MLDNVYILNRNKQVVATLSTEGSNPFFDFSYHEYLTTGASTFDFSIILDRTLEEALLEKNFVLFERNGKLKMFQIMTCEDEEVYDGIQRKVYSETVGLELANSYVRATTIEGNMNKFLTTILQDTNYQVGYISSTLENLIVTTKITEPTSVYTLIQNAIADYDNCEVEFDTVCASSIYGQYQLLINVYGNGERGNRKYKRIDYNFNSYGMTRVGDASQFCSGLIGIGQNNIDFKDIEWKISKGDPLDKPLGQDFLLDPDAHATFSNGDRYILGKYSSSATTSVDLINDTYKKLQELKQVKYTYDVPVYLTEIEYEDVEIGDYNYITNDKFNPPLQLEARVSELEITDGKSTLVFSNYKEVKSKIASVQVDLDILAVRDVVDSYFPITSSGIADGAIVDGKIETTYLQEITSDIVSAGKVVTEELIAKEITAIDGKFENLDTKYATIDNLNSTNATIETLKTKDAHIENIVAGKLSATEADLKYATIDNLNSTNATIENLDTKYATIDLANIANGSITNAMIDKGAVGTAQIADGSITSAKIVELTANLITAGTLSVDRLLINGTGENGEQSLLFTLNNLGELVSTNTDTLDGGILTERSITADKLVARSITSENIAAKCITANEILSNTITGDEICGNTITGNHIIANTINGNHIEANSINADHIQSNSINAEKIAVGDFTNYFTKPYNSNFTGSGGVALDGYVIRNDGQGTNNYQHISLTGKLYSLVGGEKFRITGKVKTGSGTPSTGLTFKVQGSWRDADGNIISGSSTVLTHTTRTGDFQWNDFNSVLTVASMPTNASYYSVKAYISDDTIGRVHLQAFTMQKMMSGELVVDGAINGQTIIGATIKNAESDPKFQVLPNGNMKIGGNTTNKCGTSYEKAQCEITSTGTIYSASNTGEYTKISEGLIEVNSFGVINGNDDKIQKTTLHHGGIQIGDMEIGENWIGNYLGSNQLTIDTKTYHNSWVYSDSYMEAYSGFRGIGIKSTGSELVLACNNANLEGEDAYSARIKFRLTDGNYYFNPHSNGATRLVSSSYKWASIWCAQSALNTSSDRRTKTDISYYDEDDRYKNMFMELKPCVFKKTDSDFGRHHSGFIAQEVEDAMNNNNLDYTDFGALLKIPVDKDGEELNINNEEQMARFVDYEYGLRYGEFTALNTYMIQEAHKEIEELKEIVKQQQKLIDELMKRG